MLATAQTRNGRTHVDRGSPRAVIHVIGRCPSGDTVNRALNCRFGARGGIGACEAHVHMAGRIGAERLSTSRSPDQRRDGP